MTPPIDRATAVAMPLPVAEPPAASGSGVVRAHETSSTRDPGQTPLAHVPTARDYSLQHRLLAHFAGAAAGTAPVVVGDVLGSVVAAAVSHGALRPALQEAGIQTGYRLAGGVLLSLGASATGHYLERRRGGSGSGLDKSERQVRTGIAAAALSASTNIAIDFGLGMAAQATNKDSSGDPQQAALETAASMLISGAVAAAGATVAYKSSETVAHVTNHTVENATARYRKATAKLLGRRAAEPAESAQDEMERGAVPIEMAPYPAASPQDSGR